jgi:hypothetical protein
MQSLGLVALFGVVGYLLSFGIFIPRELSFFQLLAAVGMMAGYPIGRLSSGVNVILRITLLVLASLVCVAASITYVIRVQLGQSDMSDIVILALLITAFFFSFAFMMPFAGVIADKASQKNTGAA